MRSTNELNQKLEFFVEELLTNGAAEMAKFENEKKIIFVLAENIVKPLLRIIGEQMQTEYAKQNQKEFAKQRKRNGPRITFNFGTIAKEIRNKLVIPSEMLKAEEMINAF